MKNVSDFNDLMIITENGLTIRLAVDSISLLGRATQGVRLINLKEDDSIASVARVVNDSEEEQVFEVVKDEDEEQLFETDQDDEEKDIDPENNPETGDDYLEQE